MILLIFQYLVLDLFHDGHLRPASKMRLSPIHATQSALPYMDNSYQYLDLLLILRKSVKLNLIDKVVFVVGILFTQALDLKTIWKKC